MAILEIENLSRSFGGLVALHHVNIDIQENEILGVIGPNGAGKTTLINIVAGIYHPTQGSLHFQGQDITKWPADHRYRRGIGRTFQLVRPLEGLNLLENIMVGFLFGQGLRQREAREKAMEICGFVGIDRVERDLTRVTALEVKKMEIGRALAARPKILFLDEIMAGLNTDETLEMIELVKKIHAQAVTVVIVEHVMRVIKELTSRVVVLDWGEVLAEGPYEEIAKNSKVISAYLGEEA